MQVEDTLRSSYQTPHPPNDSFSQPSASPEIKAKRKRLPIAALDETRPSSSDGDERRPTSLTSCESCRKGKRRCEPSPLLPPGHPDLAKLPCARCRRFALECVRHQAARRKGPAPVDLSAVSDAAYAMPNSPDSLDQVVRGSSIDTIIGTFFDYVYPLTPCLHRPTFLSNLTSRRDKTDPVFFALALMVIASTLVQVPRKLVNLDKDECEALARKCVRIGRQKMAFIWEHSVPVDSTFVVISYLEGIVHLVLGNNTAHVVTTAQANQLALTLRLNEEQSYENLDPIEAEVRRRTYWLLFQADKSTACLRARTICLRLDDASVRLPTEVDDELMTPTAILAQPVGRTPLIAGFNVNSNLFKIMNDALLLQRKSTASVDSILADLQSIASLHDRVIQTSLEVAAPLRNNDPPPPDLLGLDWVTQLHARFVNYFQSAMNPDHALNSFAVMQCNILVTQQVVRLVLMQTRNALLRQLANLTQMPLSNLGVQDSERAEDIANDLLNGLKNMPVECIATNGPSLVHKVRYVAMELMECSENAATKRAQDLLMQFLSVLSVIEGMYTFGNDVSAD